MRIFCFRYRQLVFPGNRRKEYKWQIVITVSSIRIAVVWEKCLDFVEVIHQQR